MTKIYICKRMHYGCVNACVRMSMNVYEVCEYWSVCVVYERVLIKCMCVFGDNISASVNI